VNDEAAFQAFLDEQPDNHFAREVFADWLEDRGDPRAAGYRAMGVNQCAPDMNYKYRFVFRTWSEPWPGRRYDSSVMPYDWYKLADPEADREDGREGGPFFLTTRGEAENCLALAFSRLPPDRQAALLAGALACS
jgi:uncharacterized protein (TIGR02996 family)